MQHPGLRERARYVQVPEKDREAGAPWAECARLSRGERCVAPLIMGEKQNPKHTYLGTTEKFKRGRDKHSRLDKARCSLVIRLHRRQPGKQERGAASPTHHEPRCQGFATVRKREPRPDELKRKEIRLRRGRKV